MIEIPEALTIALQVNSTIMGKRISKVTAGYTPHKFAWYCGEPSGYDSLLSGKIIGEAHGYGGLIEIKAGSSVILVGDGVGLRYHSGVEERPKKHQLLIEFEDGSAISGSVQMYGGLWCFNEGDFNNPYYLIAKSKPSPLSDQFTENYFKDMISKEEVQKLSIKAFLATEQRIPGLGNGVLQDILWKARIHPKCKVKTLSDESKELLFHIIKTVLLEMKQLGGRDTEKDLFGNNGGYKTIMSKNNSESKCPDCEGSIIKENYLGGSIYYCENCQAI